MLHGKPLSCGPWEAVDSVLRNELRRWGPLLTTAIRIPSSACLDRTNDFPSPALAHADELLLLDIERSTPFRREDVYWGWCASPSPLVGHTSFRQLIIKRSYIDPVVDRLALHHLRPVAIEVQEESGGILPVNLWPRAERRSPFQTLLYQSISVGMAVFVLLAVLVTGLSSYRRQQLIELLETERTSLADKATAIRKKLANVENTEAQLLRVHLRKAHAFRLVDVWEELTRKLPNTAWITELELEDGIVTVDGFGHSASALISALAKSPHFKDLTFASPVTRDPQRGLERFQIRMQVQSVSATPSYAP
ncbi:PilN domain-containing protein [Hyphomicrobium sp.]|uniref:PilN domain-containing protein n=1 Tax=Hyphomicrobium sp. TaxID=82 RepID=UPI003F706110